ncbi:transglycosylase domain-containing protein [Pseudonocardia sp. GCM10023141]|uniref:transglycosylase domain-containing protein n=1 Tax=Pseudonocardia sp. GCM10023141 TaxID=3252653 RepID=UPI00361833A7
MRRWRSSRRLIVLVVAAGLVLAAMSFPVVGGLGLLAAQVSTSSVAISDDMRSGILPSVTTVTDSAGTPIAYLDDQFRIPVAADAISPSMKAAIIAIEDRRFYDHGGVDPVGTVRALINDASGGERQGGSTLTQQYVKNYDLYVTAKTDAEREAAVAPSVARKITEAELAVELDNQLSKEDILARYLNLVYFGRGAYGVEAAAKVYFGTTAAQLTVPQSALLAGMVQSPADYDPVEHPDASKARRDLVISQMQSQGSISAAQAATATAEPVGVPATASAPAAGCTAAGDAGYFCAYVEEYLGKSGITPQQLESGGYTVRTTLDPKALAAVKASIDAQAPPTTPHVADVMSLIKPGTTRHEVVAMAANRTYGNLPGQSSYGLPYEPENLGAGSVYKIFTAATALEKGVAGINTVIDVPASGSPIPGYNDGDGRPLSVHNAGNYPARLTLTDALATSPNTAFVELEEQVGVPAVVDMALRLGMTSLATTPANGKSGSPSVADVVKSQNQGSFTLGVSPTSGLELANVAATLASHGTWCPPTPIQSVTGPDGKPVALSEPPCTQALDPAIADTLMNGLSKDDAAGGTSAAAAGNAGWRRPIAAKTGTTEIAQSATFVGATPQLAAASIVFDDSSSPRPICDGSPPRSCSSGSLYGGTVPARTVYKALTTVLADQPVAPLPPADPRYLVATTGKYLNQNLNPDNGDGQNGGDNGGDNNGGGNNGGGNNGGGDNGGGGGDNGGGGGDNGGGGN